MLVTAAGAAQAQSSVTIYGLIDAGVEYVNNASAEGGKRVGLGSGMTNTSRLGFRGAEDLGRGLKAVFQLESGFRADTGALTGSNDQLFSRHAFVGLEGGFGRVILGRSSSTTYDMMRPFEPMGYASHYAWGTGGSVTGRRADGMPARVSNLVKYSITTGGMTMGAMAGMGEVAGSTSQNATYGLGLAYDTGAARFGVTADRVNGLADPGGVTGSAYDKSTSAHLGSAVDLGRSTLYAGYRYYKRDQRAAVADLRSDMFWLGAKYRIRPATSVTAAVYHQKLRQVENPADPILYAMRVQHDLSKRTSLYVNLGYARAKGKQLAGLSRTAAGFGNAQLGVTAGMQHRF